MRNERGGKNRYNHCFDFFSSPPSLDAFFSNFTLCHRDGADQRKETHLGLESNEPRAIKRNIT